MDNMIVGLDIGTSKIVAIVGEKLTAAASRLWALALTHREGSSEALWSI